MSEQPVIPPRAPEPSEHFRTDHLSGDLRGRSVRGGAVTLVAQGIQFMLTTVSTVILARMLTPHDFGLIAMVTAITGFVAMFKDLGLSMATIQNKEITHGQVSTLFWINVGLSVAVMAVTAAAAPLIAWFYGEPDLVWITLAVAGSFLIGGVSVQHHALLRRQMRFTAMAIIQVASALVGVVAGVVSAKLGAGYWALLIMPFSNQAVGAVGVWIASDWRPGLPVRKSGVRRMLAFGGYLTAFNAVNYFARNVDSILIGRVCGTVPLGFYSKAYNLLVMPIRQINAPVSAVALPALSHLQKEVERYKSYYLKSLSLLTFCTAPISILCLVFADQIVGLFLGAQWMPAVPIFRMLAIGAVAQPIFGTHAWLFITRGRPDRLFKYGLIGTAVIVASFVVGLHWGPEGVALSYSCVFVVWTIIIMFLATRGTAVTLKDVGLSVVHPIIGSGVAAVAGMGWRWLLPDGWPVWLSFSTGALVFGLVYVVTLFYVFGKRKFYFSVLRSLKGA